MVRKMAENGSYYHEPPYTEEEELEIYRRMNAGPFKVLRADSKTDRKKTDGEEKGQVPSNKA
jgi:hypothetical protein